MRKYILFSFAVLTMFISCDQKKSDKSISFYHWKANAIFSDLYENALKTAQSNRVYLHYFDIESVYVGNWDGYEIFPTYVLKSVGKEYQNFEIIPVIYLTNRVLKSKNLHLEGLSNKIKDLVNQISLKQFGKKLTKIQMDCDWTESSKNVYFKLLTQLKEEFEIDVTIRLHQIKFKERTGVPPVEKGTLMLYNMGDLKNRNENSILESGIVKQYVNSETDYPLPLNIGLPIFSQTIASNKDNELKIIRNTERVVLENDRHFKKVDDMNFEVIGDTLYKGFYLSNGYNLKLEELKESEIVASYKIIKESALRTNEIIFYHLDEASLSTVNLKEIIESL